MELYNSVALSFFAYLVLRKDDEDGNLVFSRCDFGIFHAVRFYDGRGRLYASENAGNIIMKT